MGIGSDLDVENAEQTARTENVDSVAREAAALVVTKKMDRNSAISSAIDKHHREQEALNSDEYEEYEEDDVMKIRFFDSSLNGTKIPKGREAQVSAIASELWSNVDAKL